ncbi:O-antigen ligase family protein [Brucella sp. IR073]|uniref:O-antigen ligase family protein n=1 Tax=unclassified Brucella TaxID=2632610 RepID=UPI003B97DAB0
MLHTDVSSRNSQWWKLLPSTIFLPAEKLPFIESLFLVAVLLGPAIAYSKLYLFHLVLLALLIRTAISLFRNGIILPPKSLRWDAAFFIFFLGWYGLSILWSPNRLYALQYCVYVGMGVLTVYYTAEICRTVERLRSALLVIMATISIEITISIMEGLRFFRLPSSPYSPLRWIVGQEPISFAGQSPRQIYDTLGWPTGFTGNPNNLAATLVLMLPLFLLTGRWWIAVLGALSTYCVVSMTDARAGAIGFAIVIALWALLFIAHRLGFYGKMLLGATIIAMMIAGPALVGSHIQALADPSRGERLGSYDVRIQLIRNGLNALYETYGLGVGAGGSIAVQERAADAVIGNIRSMHNFWIELLVDGGVVFAALFFIWVCSLVWRLWGIGRSSSDHTLRYVGSALVLSFAGFSIGAIGPSSVIYMLPMWMVIGLALAAVRLNDKISREPRLYA